MSLSTLFPTQRRSGRPRWRQTGAAVLLRLLPGALLGGVALHCAAQSAPDTGRLLQDQQRSSVALPAPHVALPALAPAASPTAEDASALRVRVTAFRLRRNSAFDDATLTPLLADLVGQELGLAELNGAAARLTAFYRQRGYFIASAYLPAQQIRDGVVELTILEGNLGTLTVANHSALADQVVQSFLPQLQPGQPLRQETLERSLLLLKGLPGVEVQSTVTPGASLGVTDLDIRVDRRAGVSGTVSLDNYGNRFSGAWRLGTGLNVGGPLRLGDAVSLRASASDARFRYARLAWQVPLGSSGLQGGAAWSTMRYQLGLDFASLQAHGVADIGSLYALYPLTRSRLANLNLQATLERKRLEDRTDSIASLSDKRIDVLTVGLSGDRLGTTDAGALTAWSLAYAGGSLRLAPASAQPDSSGQRAAGRYDKLLFQLSRQQWLAGAQQGWGWSGRVSGQLAANTLDSSEKFSLGGAQGVRAYPQGEAACDDAWLASLELNYTIGNAWQLAGFADRAGGRFSHAPDSAAARSRTSLSGLGLSASYRAAAGFDLAVTLAWRAGSSAPLSDRDRSPRLWLQAQTYF